MPVTVTKRIAPIYSWVYLHEQKYYFYLNLNLFPEYKSACEKMLEILFNKTASGNVYSFDICI